MNEEQIAELLDLANRVCHFVGTARLRLHGGFSRSQNCSFHDLMVATSGGMVNYESLALHQRAGNERANLISAIGFMPAD